jgi:hypothetical protein
LTQKSHHALGRHGANIAVASLFGFSPIICTGGLPVKLDAGLVQPKGQPLMRSTFLNRFFPWTRNLKRSQLPNGSCRAVYVGRVSRAIPRNTAGVAWRDPECLGHQWWFRPDDSWDEYIVRERDLRWK